MLLGLFCEKVSNVLRNLYVKEKFYNNKVAKIKKKLTSLKDKVPYWNPFFGKFADNQYILYELLNEHDHVNKLFKNCYKDNLHSIWANGELYRKGNSKPEFCKILEKNILGTC